jgi:hypothetical protein
MSFQENKKTGRINAAAAALLFHAFRPKALNVLNVIGRSSGSLSVVHLPIPARPIQWFEETTGVIHVE